MASVEELYQSYGIIHSNDCAVCEVVSDRTHKGFTSVAVKWVDRILIGILLLGIGFGAGLIVAWQPLPLEHIYQEFNHFKMYEDGSYEGRDKYGIEVEGCIPGTRCKD